MTPRQMMLKVFPEELEEDRAEVAASATIAAKADSARNVANALGISCEEAVAMVSLDESTRQAVLQYILEEEEKEAQEKPA